MFLMVLNRWKCLFNFVMLFNLRGIFFNFRVLLNFLGKLSRFLIGVVLFFLLGVWIIFGCGTVDGCFRVGGWWFWDGLGVLFEWIIILLGMVGIFGLGVDMLEIIRENKL